jgi:hypothetical protein
VRRPRPQSAGAVEAEGRVQHRERLERRRRRGASRAARHDERRVEHLEQRQRLRAALLEVDRTAQRAILFLIDEHLPVIALRRRHVGSAHSQVEVAGRRQHRVAKRLGVHPPERELPEEPVVGIDRHAGRTRRARLAVSRRRHDLAVERLHAPAVGHIRLAR